MHVAIPCELYTRFSEIPQTLAETESRKYLRSIYIERKNNAVFVVSTNIKTAAIEYLGESEGPDECCAIVIDKALVQQCEQEIPFLGMLDIVANPLLGFTAIKTTFGYTFNGNAGVTLPDDHEFQKWREWFPDEMPTKSSGVMHWRVDHLYALAASSPSGGVMFPRFIDEKKPVVLTDDGTDNWRGLFLPSTNEPNTPSTLPDWI